MHARQFWFVLLPAALAGTVVSACGDDDTPTKCDVSNPDCPAGTVCVAEATEGTDGLCQAVCDPSDPDACTAGQVCDPLETGEHTCFDPIVMRGVVFDITDESPIEGARVAAADDTGAAVTDVVVTDANGEYHLTIPVQRDATGAPTQGIFTLRVAAAGYLPYPHGIRPAIPVDASSAVQGEAGWTLSNPTTDVALIPLPAAQQGLGSISGKVDADQPAGTLVVAECAAPPCPHAYADRSGDYAILNVPAGDYTVTGYKAGLQLTPVALTLADAEDRTGVDLAPSPAPLGTVTGSVNLVNPGDGQATSVVLIPESTFQQITDTYVRGEVVPGLRDPAPGMAPDITGAFSIHGVPAGSYVVLAAFENDLLVRDPDPSIAGTQIVHITVDETNTTFDLADSFKVTGALTMVGPGASGPEAVDPGAVTFSWADDSSEDFYVLTVYDAFGNEVWHDPSVPRVTGSETVEVSYGGPALEPGMYYQWRAESWRNSGPISTTEDLLGVFFVPADLQ